MGLPPPARAAKGEEPLLEEEEEEEEEENAAAAQVRGSCPVCQVGVLVETTWPRPTIAQLMQLPLDRLRQYRLPFQ